MNDRVSKLAFWSIVVAIAVMGIKLVAWYLSGSIALYSDALESTVNVIAALVVWATVRVSRKPADENHPFGHHKAEYFSAVVEGVLVVIAALLIFQEAIAALTSGYELHEPGAGMVVNALAAAINGIWAWILISTGRRERSPALTADGKHILADVITSAGVLFGLVVATISGLAILDPLMAIVVGINVLREGWKVIASSVGGLMDTAVDSEQNERIRSTIRENAEGAIEVHDIRTRISGPVSFVEFHLVVDGKMSVSASHAICDRLENAIREALPGAKVTIHVEPHDKRKKGGLKL